MKANELMIGDYLFSIIDRYDHVEKRPCRITGIRNDGDSPMIQTDDSDVWYPVETYEPVPLTPEILEKNGFVTCSNYHDDAYYYKEDDNVMVQIGDQWCFFQTNQDDGYPNVSLKLEFKYVHQLQQVLRLFCGIDKEIEL